MSSFYATDDFHLHDQLLGTGITVFLDPVTHALGRHPESLGDLADLVTPVTCFTASILSSSG